MLGLSLGLQSAYNFAVRDVGIILQTSTKNENKDP